jgi:3-hydroxymyristoyl/3-hydroxydecanoyl-(acyl carrier protein) dehydratase
MPGVFVEAMAQTGGILVLSTAQIQRIIYLFHEN